MGSKLTFLKGANNKDVIRSSHRTYAYFFAGFILSTILALAAFCISTIYWYANPSPEKGTMNILNVTKCEKRIVGYYGGFENRELKENQISHFTHIVFAFLELNSTGRFSFDSEEKEKLFGRMIEKAKNRGVKVMFSTGWIGQWSDTVPEMDRDTFINLVIDFINTHHLDGVDFNFEWNEPHHDKARDVIILKELKSRLLKEAKSRKRKPFILSVMAPSTNLDSDDEIYLNALLGYVDFMNFHSMNFYKLWKNAHGTFTGDLPLTMKNWRHSQSIDSSMKFLACSSRAPEKLNMPVNFFGVCWWARNEGEYVPWRKLNSMAWKSKTVSYRGEPNLEYNGDIMYMLFDYAEDVRMKMKYASDKNIGGVVIWRIEFDDDQKTLLNAVIPSCSTEGEMDFNYNCDD